MSDKVSGESAFGMETTVSSSALNLKNIERQAAVLLAEVSGNARLHEKLSGGEALRAVDRCLKRMERAVEGFSGRLIKVVGAEVMAVFDTADEAFQAAVEMQERVADLPPVSGVKLAIRVGFAYGLVSENDGNVAGEAVSVAAHLTGLATLGQVLASLAAQSSLSPALKKATRDLELSAANGQFPQMKIFELITPESSGLAMKTADRPRLFYLRYAGDTLLLDGTRSVINMGRSSESDVVVRDRRGSRNHARIERRGERVVLIDTSTNGTFVTFDGKPEFFIRREECVLQGRGVICFAASAASVDADCAQFDFA